MGDFSTYFPLNTPAKPQLHKTQRSMSESVLQPCSMSTASRKLVATHTTGSVVGEDNTSVKRGRSASASDAIKNRTTLERPQRARIGLPSFSREHVTAGQPSHSLVEAVAPDMYENMSGRVKHFPATLIPPNASDIPNGSPYDTDKPQAQVSNFKIPWSPASTGSQAVPVLPYAGKTATVSSPLPERKLSAALASSIPFVIAMGSPHNPALITASSTMAPSSCSITRNAPLKLSSNVSRAGVGGTMASSTPLTSPISPVDISRLEQSSRPSSTKPNHPASRTPSRNNSQNSGKQIEDSARSPRTPTHSRSGSGSSIRTAIRLPKMRDKEKEELHKMRKDSISLPRPLGSPFSLNRSMSLNADGRQDGGGRPDGGVVYGIGEAI